jgi:hypothetical protein
MLLLVAGFVARADVVINEVVPNPAGVDSGLEWIEIVNNGAAAVDLTDWLIEKSTGGFFQIEYTFPVVTIDPGERIVIGEDLVTDADLNLAAGDFFAFGNATLTGDAIHLCDENFNIIDTLVYGPNNNDGFDDDTGGLAVPAPGPLEDESVARLPDGVDTDDSSVDFVVDATPTPGDDNAFEPPVPPVITGVDPGLAGQNNTWTLTDAAANADVLWIWGSSLGSTAFPNGLCPGVDMGISTPKRLGNTITDANGVDDLVVFIPAGASGKTMHVQAILPATCEVTNVASTAFP